MHHWIDFKELRSKLDFEQVLRYYKVEVKRKGSQHHGYCPLPNHKGKKNSVSFSANLDKGIFHCFGCGAKGNLLDFAALMENADPKDGMALRKVAAQLQKRFCPELRSISESKPKAEIEKKVEPKNDLQTIINPPLNFDLKGLDATHPYLLNRGFTAETIKHFGLGFCSRGMLKDRIAIPLCDHDGKLIGYAGRVVDDSAITEDNPRYRFPGKRERSGTIFEFHKTLFLYNGFRFKNSLDELTIVEGFTGVWWLFQSGFANVVATMGSDCSERQAELIVSLVKLGGNIWIMTDGNQAGERCAVSLLRQISPYRYVRWVKLTHEKQPTDFTTEELKNRFIL